MTYRLNNIHFEILSKKCETILIYLILKNNKKLIHEKQEKMRNLKNAVFRLQSKVSSLRKALLLIIDDDESMALMSLTRLRNEPDLYR